MLITSESDASGLWLSWNADSPRGRRWLEDAVADASNLQTVVTGIVASVAAAVLTHAEPGENATVLSVG